VSNSSAQRVDSAEFVDAIDELFARDVAVCATIDVFTHPFTDELKRRPDVRRIAVTPENREDLAVRLLSLFSTRRSSL
jgi:nucleoside-triphosphatase THEP1